MTGGSTLASLPTELGSGGGLRTASSMGPKAPGCCATSQSYRGTRRRGASTLGAPLDCGARVLTTSVSTVADLGRMSWPVRSGAIVPVGAAPRGEATGTRGRISRPRHLGVAIRGDVRGVAGKGPAPRGVVACPAIPRTCARGVRDTGLVTDACNGLLEPSRQVAGVGTARRGTCGTSRPWASQRSVTTRVRTVRGPGGPRRVPVW